MIEHGGKRRGDAGMALLMALGLLFLFWILGTTYVVYMATEMDRTGMVLGKEQARLAAEAGVESTIASLAKSVGTYTPLKDIPKEVSYNLYNVPRQSEELVVTGQGVAAVTVSDEAARVNVNVAPAAVLAAALGISPEDAKALRSKLPKIGDDEPSAEPDKAHWLASVDDLDAVQPGVLAKANRDFLTVYSLADPAKATDTINLNAASPEVLAAVLGVAPDVAKKLQETAASQPFKSLDEVAKAAGKEPAALSYAASGARAKELGFVSRCFRIVSDGSVRKDGQTVKGRVRIEAVVLFDGPQPRIQYWNESQGVDKPAESKPAEPAADKPAGPAETKPATPPPAEKPA